MLILGRGAARDFINPLTGVLLAEAAEAIEGGEKLVVAAASRGGNEAAQRESIDEAVVEVLM